MDSFWNRKGRDELSWLRPGERFGEVQVRSERYRMDGPEGN